MTFSRRSMLGLMAAAPVAAPEMARAAMAPSHEFWPARGPMMTVLGESFGRAQIAALASEVNRVDATLPDIGMGAFGESGEHGPSDDPFSASIDDDEHEHIRRAVMALGEE